MIVDLEEHHHDGLVFRKSEWGDPSARQTGWEVYWGDWIAIGEDYDQDWDEIKADWPQTKQEIIKDKLMY